MGESKQVAVFERKPRDHHHRIAYLVATGMRVGEIARQTGMSVQRISYLKSSREFQDLVKLYLDKAMAIEWDIYKQAVSVRAAVHILAAEELRDRLEDNPESFSARDLLEIYGDTADRMGMGKVQQSVNMSIDLADSLAEARRRELRLSASPSRDAEGGGSLPAEGPAPA